MSRPALLVALLPLFTVACGKLNQFEIAAEDLLAVAAVQGEEDYLTRGSSTPEDHLQLGHECDPSGTFNMLFQRYDEDSSGALAEGEGERVRGDWPAQDPHQEMMVHVLHMIYDLDDSFSLEDSEREAMMSDFAQRCEVLHDKLLTEFDADGDGQLSEEEEEAARAAMEAERAERQAEMEERCEEGGTHGGPPDGERGGRGRGGRPSGPPPFLVEEFDTDGDGDLSSAERAAAREIMRERIRAGEMPIEPPQGE
jgi:hypothetical protein